MSDISTHMKCIDNMTNDLLEIADILEDHLVSVKLDDGRYLNPAYAIRSKVDIIWEDVQAIVTPESKREADLRLELDKLETFNHAMMEYMEGLERKLEATRQESNAKPCYECEFVVKDNMNETEGIGDVWFECSECGAQFDYYADDWLMKQNYCPHCGKAVKR